VVLAAWGLTAMFSSYQLVRGDTVLGVVTVDPNESDFPFLVGRLEPSPAYASVQPLFEELDRVLIEDGFDGRYRELHERLMAPGVWARSPSTGQETKIGGLHVSPGNRVSWMMKHILRGGTGR
jgi:hypothetical protein